MNEKPKRLTKEELIERVKDLWTKFYNRVPGVKFEEFYEEVLQEFQKQNQMSDEDLQKYRLQEYQKLVGEMNKDIPKTELEKLEKENLQTVDQEDILKYGKQK